MDWQDHLERWHKAGFLDAETAAKIHAFEAAQPDVRRIRWPVIVALSCGGLLLAAGLFLFVQAHWDTLSPFARIAVTMAALAALHAGGAYSAAKFPALATTLHAIGTAGLGGAIAISGQVFHMDEHWPTAVLLWSVGAWAGWAVLRDIPQLVMAAVLTPAWVVAEIVDYQLANVDSSLWTAAFVALLSLAYLGANRPNETEAWRHALAAIGGAALIPAWILASVMSAPQASGVWMLLLPLPVAYALRREAAWPILAGAALLALQVEAAIHRMPIAQFLIAGAAATALAAWGVAELRKERVNLGLAGFALTVVTFYFSYVADAINQSLGLIVLGLAFLAGGWALERFRRQLMRRIEASHV